MKIIHCADIHLDSPLCGVADSIMRRNEILLCFCDVVEYANNNKIEAILVAGDLFDSDFVSQSTFMGVVDIIKKYPQISFFVLKGNHGGTKAYENLWQQNLKNLHFFSTGSFKTFELDDVAITAVELTGNDQQKYDNLALPAQKYNIVMLHGDTQTDAYGYIDLKRLEAAGTNYLALGHKHSFMQKKLGSMKLVYSGILETRGFDEQDQTGFVVLDTKANSVKFVPQARRSVEVVEIDVSNISSGVALLQAVSAATANVGRGNYVQLVLVGQLSPEISLEVLQNNLKDRFFALNIQNKTKIPIDVQKLTEEFSLKGEFLKLALQIEDSRQQNDIIKLGLSALNGEEVSL